METLAIREAKRRAREALRQREAALDPAYVAQASKAIFERLIAMPAFKCARTVFCFVSMLGEVDTRPILRHALAKGKRVCVPLCLSRGCMEAREISDIDELSPGRYGILEPSAKACRIDASAIDLAIVPALSCTPGGERLGRGAGFYDRFLAGYERCTVAICLEQMMSERVPVEAHDRAVAYVLTEKRIYHKQA